MLCQECGKKPATVHVTKIINNQKTERHLCEDCAAEHHQLNFGFNPDFSLNQFLSKLLNYDHPFNGHALTQNEKGKCSMCGLTYDQFVHSGKLGCNNCYDTFGHRINALLKRVHGASAHTGKVPKRTGGKYRIQRELSNLRQQLEEHIRLEEFEKAAEIRDKIKALESELNG